MGSIKSPTTARSNTNAPAGSSSHGRDVLHLGVILPTKERHPVGWLAARALAAELAWRNAPTDLHLLVEERKDTPWASDTSAIINKVPENFEELGSELDVVVGFVGSAEPHDFYVNPLSAGMTMDDAVALLPRYLTPSRVQETHPAPSLAESILVDAATDSSMVIAAEVARHAQSRALPISLLGSSNEQAHFATQLARYERNATDIGTDLDPEQFGAVVQRSAVVLTSDPALHHLARVLHGRSVLLDANADDQYVQRELWRAGSALPDEHPGLSIEEKIARLAEVVEQTALLRLGRPISNRSVEQEIERNQQLITLQQQQAGHWIRQRHRSQRNIDQLRQQIKQLEEERDTALADATTSRIELQRQHHRLNELEMGMAQQDQGPARLQRSVDWPSVMAQIERDLLAVLRWFRRQFGR